MKELVKGDSNALAQIIEEGLANEEDLGLALRTVQVALGGSFIKEVESTRDGFTRLNSLINRAVDKAVAQIEPLLENDAIDYASLLEMATTLQKNQVAFLELQRKVLQSPNKIFPEDLLSSEEKKLLAFFKSFKTQQEKEDFIKAVEKAMKDTNDFTE